MKKALLFLIIAITFLSSRAQESFGGMMFSAKLDTAQQDGNLLVASKGNGIAGFSYHNDTLWFQITANGLTGPIITAHIHTASGNGIEYSLLPYIDGNSIKGYLPAIRFKEGELKPFLEGQYYVNIHTAANPNGEISGRILPEADVNYKAVMDMAQAGHTNPEGKSPMGLASFNLGMDNKKLEINVLVNDLTSNITNAHLHYGAPGVSGPAVIPLMPFNQGNSFSGTFDLANLANPSAFLDSLKHGKVYVNVHTSGFPAGEIRGQLQVNHILAFDTWMGAAQETGSISPNTPASAKGLCNFSINSQCDSLWVNLQSDQLSGPITGVHFHTGKAGVSGGVLVSLTTFISGNKVSGILTAANPAFTGNLNLATFVKMLLNGEIYVNMHTALNPAGEVRGQPASLTRKGLVYDLCPKQVNSVLNGGLNSQGSGFVSVDRWHTNLHFGVAVANLGSHLNAAHFHNALPGLNGGVVHAFPVDSTIMEFWNDATFTTEMANKFEAGSIYSNFHTSNNPGGEIRGQVSINNLCSVTTGIPERNRADNVEVSIYPNPIQASSVMRFTLPQNSTVSLNLYNLLGKKMSTLAEGKMSAGEHIQQLESAMLPEGVYFYRLVINGKAANNGKIVVGR
jgi:hypothetical protein